jgi:hypothetical protein
MKTKQEIALALKAANDAKPETVRASGCGRAYIVISGERAEINAISAACKKMNLMFLRKAYGVSGPAIYIGYDNASGIALGRTKRFRRSALSARYQSLR